MFKLWWVCGYCVWALSVGTHRKSLPGGPEAPPCNRHARMKTWLHICLILILTLFCIIQGLVGQPRDKVVVRFFFFIDGTIEIVVNSRRRMHLCMQDDQNGQKMMVLTSAEETRLTCFILLQNIFFWSNQPSLTADVNTIINLPWYPRKIIHFSLVRSPSRVYYDFYVVACISINLSCISVSETIGCFAP